MSASEFVFKAEAHPFGENEEHAIVSMAMDLPEFFSTIADHIKPEMFRQPEARHVIQAILDLHKKYNHVPPRGLITDYVKKNLTTAHDWRPIVALLERPLSPREAPMLKDRITEWAKGKQFELLYGDEAITALTNKQYDKIAKIVEKANAITAATYAGIWLAESMDLLFAKDSISRITTGFSAMDEFLHGGGPAKKEVLVWAAATGVGKTIVMVNCGAKAASDGHNVLHITLETSAIEILRRYVGVVTKVPITNIDLITAGKNGQQMSDDIMANEGKMRERLSKFHRNKGSVLVTEFEADSISINHIKQFIDHLGKSKGWKPDMVIIDYMELMIPRNITHTDQDSKEYLRQKKIATEIRALAQSENVLVVTATQGNRKSVADAPEEGGGGKKDRVESAGNMGLSKLSNSYDKAMPMDYIISINQTKMEKDGVDGVGKFRFYIEKNRHGPNNKWIHALVNYSTMAVVEQTSGDINAPL